MKCPYCNNNVREIDEVCDKCGRRMSELGVGNRTCLSCGKLYDWYMPKCPHCGADTVSTTVSESKRDKKELSFLFWSHEISPDAEEGFLKASGSFLNKGISMTISRSQFKARMLLSCMLITAVILVYIYGAMVSLPSLTWIFMIPAFLFIALLVYIIAYSYWALS